MDVTFHAQWNARIESYRDPQKTVCQKLGKLIYNVISVVIPLIGLIRLFGYFLNKYMYKSILPASLLTPKELERTSNQFEMRWNSPRFAQNFERVPFSILTPDGIKLAGTHIRNRNANPESPTIVLFQPNPTISKYDLWWKWMAEYSMDRNKPCNFVIFDYRGTGESKTHAKDMRDLILDADSILQYVENHLQVQNLVVYGFSLGGGLSAKALSLRPEYQGKYINERSFAHTAKVITHNMKIGLGRFFSWLSRQYHWELNGLKACEKIRGRKLMVYHPEDPLIPPHAAAGPAMQKLAAPNTSYAELQSPIWYGEHTAPIDVCLDVITKKPAADAIMDFVFDEPQPVPAAAAIAG